MPLLRSKSHHILWHCKETETKRLQMDIRKEIWNGGKQEMEKLIKYVKEIVFFENLFNELGK
jgi:hypothetical protein